MAKDTNPPSDTKDHGADKSKTDPPVASVNAVQDTVVMTRALTQQEQEAQSAKKAPGDYKYTFQLLRGVHQDASGTYEKRGSLIHTDTDLSKGDPMHERFLPLEAGTTRPPRLAPLAGGGINMLPQAGTRGQGAAGGVSLPGGSVGGGE
jgi:hypothetical protein